MLTLVMFMTIIFVGVAFYVNSLLKVEQRSRDAFEIRKQLVAKAQEVHLLLLEDETPQSNHLFDSYMDELEGREDVSLKDISSKLNLNWIDEKMLLHLNSTLLEPPDVLFPNSDYPVNSAGGDNDFISYREKYGPLPNSKVAYGNYINPEVFDSFFTDYNYFGFNVTDQFVHGKLFATRTGSESDKINMQEAVGKYLTKLGGNKKAKLLTPATLEDWYVLDGHFGQSAYDLLFPLLNAEPEMNIHFVPAEIIRGILSHPDYKKGAPEAKSLAEQLVKMRENREDHEKGLTPDDLDLILGVLEYPATRIKQYFGFITWFWEITANEGDYQLRWIIARIPPKKALDAADDPVFKLVKEEFTINGIAVPGDRKATESTGEDAPAADTGGEVPVDQDPQSSYQEDSQPDPGYDEYGPDPGYDEYIPDPGYDEYIPDPGYDEYIPNYGTDDTPDAETN